jgi:Family of unknown function (DUF6492)
MKPAQDNLKFALITPSYAPDFERCKLLVQSVENCLVDDTKQYIIVDRRDFQLFKPLASSRIQILVVEEILPSWILRVPGTKKWWLSLRTLPIKNWVLQQLVKMSIFDVIDENVVVFCDSDNTFIRPFDMKSRLVKDGKLALLRVNFQNEDVYKWIENSKKLLGIENKEIPAVMYVSNMISWHRDNVLAMRRRLEEVNHKDWIRALCQYQNISEYTLYGVFVEHLVGLQRANHFLFDDELIKASWSIPLDSKDKVEDFFDNLKEENVGVMIHSKHDIPLEMYRYKIEAFWQKI